MKIPFPSINTPVPPASIKNILLIRNGLLGDAVFITPVLRRLHEHFPQADIDIVTSTAAADLFRHSYVRTAYGLFPKFSLWHHLRVFLSLRRHRYDLVFVQEMNTHYTLMAALIGGKHLVGFRTPVSFLLDTVYQRREDTHAVDAELATVRDWTIAPGGMDRTELFVSAAERESIDAMLGEYGVSTSERIVCVHVGTSGQNSERQWVLGRYAELADRLNSNLNLKIVFTGIEKDRENVNTIRSAMRSAPIDLVGKTPLRHLMALLKRTEAIIGPDTGTLHIATALGTPAVMLMGYADKNHTGAYGADSINVSVDLPCIGCVRRDPKPAQWDMCKALRPVKCMELLSVDVVYDAVVAVMNRKKNVHQFVTE